MSERLGSKLLVLLGAPEPWESGASGKLCCGGNFKGIVNPSPFFSIPGSTRHSALLPQVSTQYTVPVTGPTGTKLNHNKQLSTLALREVHMDSNNEFTSTCLKNMIYYFFSILHLSNTIRNVRHKKEYI